MLKNRKTSRKEGKNMKRFGFMICLLLCLSQLGCEVDIAGREILGSNEKYEEICGVKMVFHKTWDNQLQHYYWTGVELDNELDSTSHVEIWSKDYDQRYLDTYLTSQQEGWADIQIEEHQDVYVEVYYSWGEINPCDDNPTKLGL